MKNYRLRKVSEEGFRTAGQLINGVCANLVVDIIEDSSLYQITAEIPGVSENDLSVSIRGQELTIKGLKRELPFSRADFLLAERAYGAFERSFVLPREADVRGITFILGSGLLTIRLPKTRFSRPAKIVSEPCLLDMDTFVRASLQQNIH